MARVFVSLGSNIDKERCMLQALNLLESQYGPLQRSTLYESPALGFEGPDFYNMVIAFDSEEAPHNISENLRRIEDSFGRVRGADAFMSRTMDLDILLYGDRIIDDGVLSLPRPEICEHEFVLAPLAEICGGMRHPLTNGCISDLWRSWREVHGSRLRAVSLPDAEAETPAAVDR